MKKIYDLSQEVFILQGLFDVPFKEYTDCMLAIFTIVSDLSFEEITKMAKSYQLYKFEITSLENIG